jgi:hypothetical protein
MKHFIGIDLIVSCQYCCGFMRSGFDSGYMVFSSWILKFVSVVHSPAERNITITENKSIGNIWSIYKRGVRKMNNRRSN